MLHLIFLNDNRSLKDSNLRQNRESTKGHSKWTMEKRHDKFRKTGLNNCSISKWQTKNDRTRCKRSLLACHFHCQCSIETLVIRWKLSSVSRSCNWGKIRIGWEVTVTCRGSDCHTREMDTSSCWIRYPHLPLIFLNDDFKRSKSYRRVT